MQEPIFEVIDGDKHYKIYANGQIKGFDKGALVNNRIMDVIAYAIARSRSQQLGSPAANDKSSEILGLSQLMPP